MKQLLSATLLFLASCTTIPGATDPVREADGSSRAAVEAVLDAFHDAAALADGEAYFGAMAEGSVFLGTDATERWDREAFRGYADPYFSQGRGWTYKPIERHVYVRGEVAWFDERLWNEKYGESRGTGVLRRFAQGWRIVHYSLTFPIPNAISGEVTKQIRALSEDS